MSVKIGAHIRTWDFIGAPVPFVPLVPCSKKRFGMLEKEIELHLVMVVKKMGGRAVKFISPGFDGMPDRLVLLPEGKCGFVEVKAPGKKPRALQLVRIKMLKALGFKAYVLDSKEQIEEIIDDIRAT